MQQIWKDLVRPLAEALRASTVVETRLGTTAMSAPLAEWADKTGTLLHVVDPGAPVSPDAPESTRMVVHDVLSLQALPQIGPVDLALLSGDANWFTVLNELRMLERSADRVNTTPPVILVHNVGWPWGRRDTYADPEVIPPGDRQAYAHMGVLPDQIALSADGYRPEAANAIYAETPHNGVLTAVEDFVAESRHRWRQTIVPGEHGFALLWLEQHGEATATLELLVKRVTSAAWLHERVEQVERERVLAELHGPAGRPQPSADGPAERSAADAPANMQQSPTDAAAASTDELAVEREPVRDAELDDARRSVERLQRELDDVRWARDALDAELLRIDVAADAASELPTPE